VYSSDCAGPGKKEGAAGRRIKFGVQSKGNSWWGPRGKRGRISSAYLNPCRTRDGGGIRVLGRLEAGEESHSALKSPTKRRNPLWPKERQGSERIIGCVLSENLKRGRGKVERERRRSEGELRANPKRDKKEKRIGSPTI